MSMSVFQKILRAGEGRTLKRMQERVRDINALEPDIERLSDDALRAKADPRRSPACARPLAARPACAISTCS
jgi:preprotein translocase subunit SecA